MTIEFEGWQPVVTNEGAVELTALKHDRYDERADFVQDDRDVQNVLLLGIAERLELLLTLLRQEQEARR
jgi:hypothetical protein